MRDSLIAEGGERLDAFLARSFPGCSRQYWKRRIAEGSVLVEGIRREADHTLRGGEKIEIRRERRWELDLSGRVLHEDEAILVLDKPSGLIVHPLGESWMLDPDAVLAETPSLVGWLWCAGKAGIGVERMGLVHRLDRGTSGVMVVTKTAGAQQSLIAQFRDREVEKRYRAIVLGRMAAGSVEVDLAVGRKGHTRRIIPDPNGRCAKTLVTVLKTSPRASLVEARPLTGRTHQIRIHLASMGHPVLGDPEWVEACSLPPLEGSGVDKFRLMLHAWRLAFVHPVTGRRVKYEARVPGDFEECWRRVSSFHTP